MAPGEGLGWYSIPFIGDVVILFFLSFEIRETSYPLPNKLFPMIDPTARVVSQWCCSGSSCQEYDKLAKTTQNFYHVWMKHAVLARSATVLLLYTELEATGST